MIDIGGLGGDSMAVPAGGHRPLHHPGLSAGLIIVIVIDSCTAQYIAPATMPTPGIRPLRHPAVRSTDLGRRHCHKVANLGSLDLVDTYEQELQ